MCQKCVDALQLHYSHLSEVEQCELLMCATSYPLGDGDEMVKQIAELKSNTDGSLAGAIAYVGDELASFRASGPRR